MKPDNITRRTLLGGLGATVAVGAGIIGLSSDPITLPAVATSPGIEQVTIIPSQRTLTVRVQYADRFTHEPSGQLVTADATTASIEQRHEAAHPVEREAVSIDRESDRSVAFTITPLHEATVVISAPLQAGESQVGRLCLGFDVDLHSDTLVAEGSEWVEQKE